MKVQVLVATMNQTDHSLLEKLNLDSDAIVGNQCNYNKIETFHWKGHKITYLNFAEKGIGQNRNNALMRAEGEIVLFADDDMVYVDGYEKLIEKQFCCHPDADAIIFNVIENHAKGSKRYTIRKDMRVNYFSFLRYGTVRIAVKLKSVKENGIFFNQCFGGGCEYQHGEDNIFIGDCLKKGLKIYAVPYPIAELTEERESTWCKGYNERYFFDQGKLYRAISRKWWKLLCLQDAIRHQKRYQRKWKDSYCKMIKAEQTGKRKQGKAVSTDD